MVGYELISNLLGLEEAADVVVPSTENRWAAEQY